MRIKFALKNHDFWMDTYYDFGVRNLSHDFILGKNNREPQCKHHPPKPFTATIMPHLRYPIDLPQYGQTMKIEIIEEIKEQIKRIKKISEKPVNRKLKELLKDSQKNHRMYLYFL